MSRVIANLSMSVDGFIADPDDGCDDLFGWYGSGDVAFPSFAGHVFHVSETSAAFMREAWGEIGSFIMGRRLYDMTNGWNGRPPVEAPLVVLTHEAPADFPRDGVPITFATDVQAAVAGAKEAAGSKAVSVAGATVAREVLAAGLLDEIVVSLVPVVLGKGVPWFAGTADGPHRLSDPEIVAAPDVTHLRFRVLRDQAAS
jgi:dihydrofolate reductase